MPHAAMTTRRAAAQDADIIADFNLAMARETENRLLDRGVLLAGVRAVLEDRTRGEYYLVESANGIVGQLLLTYEWSDWRNGWFWWIQSVYVAPEARGGGVYRRLHEHVAELARQTGNVAGVRLYVDADNTRAQAVYEKLGMSRTNYLLYETDWSGAAHR